MWLPSLPTRFSLDRHREAFLAVHRKGKTGAVKAAFTFDGDAPQAEQ